MDAKTEMTAKSMCGTYNWEYSQFLETMRISGVIARWDYEPESLRLAGATHYIPDFRVILPDGRIEFHEVKGRLRKEGNTKIKVAADQHPYRFFMIMKQRDAGRSHVGQWVDIGNGWWARRIKAHGED